MNFARTRLLSNRGARPLALAAAAGAVLSSSERDKPSIYSSPETEIVLQEVPSELERQIGIARRQVTATFKDAHAQVQGLVSKWIGVEHAIENRIKSIISPSESLTPGILYVGVATLSGSIIARNRILPIRLILPPTLLAVSLNHFLPKTTSNLTSYFGSLEDTYFPTLAQKHNVANAHTAMTWERIKDATASGRDSLNGGVVAAVDKIQETTGLKFKETLGLGQSAVKNVESQVVEAVHAVEKKVEKKVEEVKASAESKLEKGSSEKEDGKRLV